MDDNKIIIGGGKYSDKKVTGKAEEVDVLNRISLPDAEQKNEEVNSQENEQEPIYETVWGNDNAVLRQLDEDLLADRRLFARAIFMQSTQCDSVFESPESDPIPLKKPLNMMIIDISMGGIGIICESEIATGTILSLKIVMDGIEYKIKCRVIYCFRNDDKFRAGLKIVEKNKQFVRHLKILVARLTLQSRYGSSSDRVPEP